jgi:predicted pyridoxine 5'-phosphate oxidase superfamily flavin-nucleotide-binding protein
MPGGYHSGERGLQDRFDTRRLADRIDERLVRDVIRDSDRAFIEARDMVFVATADAGGLPSCSYKGGDPGFVHVLDERTLALPNYDGNGMYRTWGNVAVNPRVGLLFIDFEGQKRLRLEGTATIEEPAAERFGEWPGAQFVVVIRAVRVYPNCPRYIHRMELVERSAYVPREEAPPPEPAWKRSEWARDVLPSAPDRG